MRTLLLIVSLFFSTTAFSESFDTSDPFLLVQEVSKNLFERISKEQTEIVKNPETLRGIVEEQLAPYMNHVYSGSVILGKYYKRIKPEDREQFFIAFREYLIATYAGILTLYTDQKVVFEPSSKVKGKRIEVKVRVLDEGKPDIKIIFVLRKNKKGQWSAYDMIAEGVSVLASEQKILQGQIRQQGIKTVTALLLEKARKPIVAKTL